MAQQFHDAFCPSLLGLPPSIRRCIYLHLGVARCSRFPILFALNHSVNTSEEVAFHGLLLSCRAIYDEASALLFSSNIFSIHYTKETDPSLQPLRNLTASSLASLTSLKIVLNQNACHDQRKGGWEGVGRCCNDPGSIKGTPLEGYCNRLHKAYHDRSLQSSHLSARSMLGEWLRTADFLSSRITPGALELSLVCDLDQEDSDAASQVVAPLLLLPELRDCHVRLCRDPNSRLGQIAQDAALQACHRAAPGAHPPSSSPSSRLLSLPRELRLRILEYTDLVTPQNEVMWTRVKRAYHYPPRGRRCSGVEGIGKCPTAKHQNCQFWGCLFQARSIEEDDPVVYPDRIGCFCRLRHAAYSSTCRCWAPPTTLFLVCRALLEDARFVFFSLNHFVVSDTLASANPYIAYGLKMPDHHRHWELVEWSRAQPPRSYPGERVAASEFLREVVPAHCLGYLRFLELVFPPYNHHCWPHEGHPALRDWVETIDWVKDKINTPGITLRLTMVGSWSDPPKFPDTRNMVTRAQGDGVLAGYDRILKPLARLGGEDGLTWFYADFAWPWKWTNWAQDKRQSMDWAAGWEWIESEEGMLNESAERFILGDRYERLHASREGLKERPWMSRYGVY